VLTVMPYFAYARADKRHGRREPITGRVVADLLQTVGAAHVVTVDLHTPQIEGFFRAPVDSLTAVPTLCRALRDRPPPDVVVVSPDVGRMGSSATSRRPSRSARPEVGMYQARGSRCPGAGGSEGHRRGDPGGG